MLADTEARDILLKVLPEVSVKAWTKYGDLYLFRVQYPLDGEEDFDPFFSVNANTGEFREFSILEDGNIDEIAALDWKEV